MKIGIVTLYGYFNYGNRLQNYALQEVLKDQDNEVETIIFKNKENFLKSNMKKILERRDNKYKIKSFNDIIRESNIKRFSKKYIKTKEYDINNVSNYMKIDSDFDLFIVGSDQVWNPRFWRESEDSIDFKQYLLQFASDDKKMSYASSFGINELPGYWINLFQSELNKFFAISAREKSGAKIIKDILNKDVPVVLDPTMLLTATQWTNKLGLEDKKEDYIVLFFLGEKDTEMQNFINSLKDKEKIVDVMDCKNTKYYCSNPKDFLNLIKNSKLVITDSFHATVFSIIFEIPFVVFGRKYKSKMNMNSRIKTLLEKFDLKDRIYDNGNIDLYKCDFSGFEKCINYERNKSLDYLLSNLKKIKSRG